MYLWQNSLVCLGHYLAWVRILDDPYAMCVPDGMRDAAVSYAAIGSLIQFALHLVQISDFSIDKIPPTA